MSHTLTRSRAFNLLLSCAACLLLVAPADAQETAPLATGSRSLQASINVSIIPRPKQVTVAQDSFRLGPGARIALFDPSSEDDRFAALDFASDVKETAGLALAIGKGRTRGGILIGRIDLPQIQQALSRAGVEAPASLSDEGYVLAVTANEVTIAGKTAAGTFYGLQTLKQLIRGDAANAFIPGVRIIDWPTMRWRGVSDDISRGPVPTGDYIKRQIRNEALFKLNMHSFYMEHTFGSASNPLIGPAGGSLTAD